MPPLHRFVTPLLALLLILAAVLPELPAIHGEFQWDDEPHISQNRNLHDAAGLLRTWTDPASNIQYYPLSITAFWLEYQAFGASGLAGYHCVNFVLHGINAVLVWLLLRRLGIPWPWVAALLFAMHPMMVESVAYLSELKNLLSGCLFLLAAHAWLSWTAAGGLRRKVLYAVCLGAFVAAMLAKSITCTFPVVMVIVGCWREGRWSRRGIVGAIPFLAAGLFMALFFAHVEHVHVGAAGEGFAFTPLDRVLIAGRAVGFYIGSYVWPAHLLVVYPRWAVGVGDPIAWAWLVLLMAALAMLAGLRRYFGAGPLAGALVFIALLSPSLGFVNFFPMLFTFVADHYLYLAAIPLAALLAGAGHAMAARLKWRSVYVQPIVACVIVIALAPLTAAQAATWQTSVTLWRSAALENTDSWYVCANFAHALVEHDQFAPARAWALHSLELHEVNSRAHFTLGRALLALGQPLEAAQTYRRGLELEPTNIPARYNFALALQQSNDLPGAEEQWRQLTGQDSANAKVWNNLATLCLHRGAYAEAEGAARRALAADPAYGLANANRGLALERLQRFPEAAAALAAALEELPESARLRVELARALSASGRREAAIEMYERVQRESPGDLGVETEVRALRNAATTAPTSSTRP